MLIVVMMGMWSDHSACWVVHDVWLYSVLYTVVISGEHVYCSVVFVIIGGVSVFCVMWSEWLMTQPPSGEAVTAVTNKQLLCKLC